MEKQALVVASSTQNDNYFLGEDFFLQKLSEKIQSFISLHSEGSLRGILREHFLTPGKNLRPRMVFALGKILAVPYEHALAWAGTCEILHNGTLIHDDLQDGDTHRRGLPTLWKKYGAPQAINAGDFLFFSAPLMVLETESQVGEKLPRALSAIYAKMGARIVCGQSFEFELNQLTKVQDLEKDYFRCIQHKTSALFLGLVEGLLVLMQREADTTDESPHWSLHSLSGKLMAAFEKIGNLFQIQDDILDLYGEKGRDGSQGNDFKEGKVSFLVVEHLKHQPEDFDFFSALLKKDRANTSDKDIESVKTLFEKNDTLKKSLGQIDRISNEVLGIQFPYKNEELHLYLRSLLGQILLPLKHLI